MTDTDEFLRLFSDIGSMQAEIMNCLRRCDPLTAESLDYARDIGRKLTALAYTGQLP